MSSRTGCPCGGRASPAFFLLAVLLLTVPVSAVQVPQLSNWTRLPSFPHDVFEAQGSIIGSGVNGWHMVVFGGFRGFPNVTRKAYSMYLNPGGRTRWVPVADLPEPLTHMAQTSHGRFFYGAGGFHGPCPGYSSRSVFRYDRITNRWSRMPSLPAPRAGGGLVYAIRGGRQLLLYSGGLERGRGTDRNAVGDRGTTWRLDLGNLAAGWVDDGALIPEARNHMAGVVSCGRMFWVGGQRLLDEKRGNSNAFTEYVPEQRRWRKGTPLPYGLGHISASTLPFACGVLTVGGIREGRTPSRDVLFWDPETDKWYTVGEYPKAVVTPVCGLINGLLVCATGEGGRQRDVFSTRLTMRTV